MMQILYWTGVAAGWGCMVSSAYLLMRMTEAFVRLRKRWLQFLTPLPLVYISNVVIFNDDIVNITYAFIGYLLVVLAAYSGPVLKKVSAVLILYPLVVSCNYLLGYLIEKDHLFRPAVLDDFGGVLKNLAIFLFWLTIYRFFFRKLQMAGSYLTGRIWVMLDIVSLVPLFVTGYMIVSTTREQIPGSMFMAAISLVSNLGILYLVTYMVENTKIFMENENLRQQQEYYRELAHNQQEIRKLRHDMNHHLSMVDAYLEQKQVEQARAYFSKLSVVAAGTNRVFCENSLVNAVLNNKYQRACQLFADIFFHIDLDEKLSIEDMDLCSLFANSLDNAIEACGKISDLEKRRIAVRARCSGGYFSCQVENSYEVEPLFEHGEYITSKGETKNHGMGVGKIREIVKKYQGNVEIGHGDGAFVVTLIIPQGEDAKLL